jgi:2-polyprenyl-6-hydroxyphenyl methylase/3-demethylubiquinone-9 3-methyltransferase
LNNLKPSHAQNWIYDELSQSWWDENGVLHLLKSMVNPWRVPYFTRKFSERIHAEFLPQSLLDVGCGGGLLAEEFHVMGYQVYGIDLSEKSISVANAHANAQGYKLHYQVGSATQLPFDDSTFDIVSCCDVLEHIPNWETAIVEASRVLRSGGLFCFDTINRTLKSYIVMIFGAQDNPTTRIFPKDTHAWHMFIRPVELKNTLETNGLIIQDMVGSKMKGNLIQTIQEIQNLKKGNISVNELGSRICLQEADDMDANYMGVAIKIDGDNNCGG